jgi:uncharacterized membrane protein
MRGLRAVGVIVFAGSTLAFAPSVHADAAFTLTTPYPDVETQPGSTVKLDLSVSSSTVDAVELGLSGLPDGWKATMRGGGFVIHAVTATADAPAKAQLEIAVPPNATAGSQALTITGTDASMSTVALQVAIDVEAQVDNGIAVTADFPSLSGDPGSPFSYNLTIANNTPESETFTFDPTAPQGWTVTASPSAEARAQTVTIDASATSTVKVTATPPDTADEGSYPIDVGVTAANGAQGKITLTAEVTGAPKLALSTADQRLDVKGQSDTVHRIPMVLANTGTADLTDVKMAGTAPTGWDVSFDPQEIATVRPNETAQVTAIVKPSSHAVAGDYSITVRSSAGSQSSNIDLRYSLEGSRTLGVLAILVIAVAILALAGVFVRFGRR